MEKKRDTALCNGEMARELSCTKKKRKKKMRYSPLPWRNSTWTFMDFLSFQKIPLTTKTKNKNGDIYIADLTNDS